MTNSERDAVYGIIGHNVRRARLSIGATQTELSQLLGSHDDYWRAVENGLKGVSVPRLVQIADVLGVSPGDLLRGL